MKKLVLVLALLPTILYSQIQKTAADTAFNALDGQTPSQLGGIVVGETNIGSKTWWDDGVWAVFVDLINKIAQMDSINYFAFTFDSSLVVGSPTGGDKGDGTLNAVALYSNGTQVIPVWAAGSAQNIYYNPSGVGQRPQVGIGVSTPTAAIHTVDSVGSNAATFSATSVSSGAKVIIEATGSGTAGPTLIFDHSATPSPGDNDSIGQFQFIGRDDNSSTDIFYGQLSVITSDVSNGSESCTMAWSVQNNNSLSQLLRLDGEEGSVTINEAGGNIDFIVEDDNDVDAFIVQGSDGNVAVASGGFSVGGGGDVAKISHANTTWDPGNLADGASESTTISVTGAAAGEPVFASLSTLTNASWQISGFVTSTNTITVTITNHSGGALDLGSGTLRIVLFEY